MKKSLSRGNSRHIGRAADQVAQEAARFIAAEASGESLITVTRAVALAHGERIAVFVSVFPDEKARTALAFLENRRAAFSAYHKEHVRLSPLPRVEFMLDDGEKNRRRLDELSGGPGGN